MEPSEVDKVKFHVTKIECHDGETLIGTLEAFDGCTYTLKIDEVIVSSKNLRDIADKLEWLSKKEGWI